MFDTSMFAAWGTTPRHNGSSSRNWAAPRKTTDSSSSTPGAMPRTPAFSFAVDAMTCSSRCAGVASGAPSSTCASAAALEGFSSSAPRVETAIEAISGRVTGSPCSVRYRCMAWSHTLSTTSLMLPPARSPTRLTSDSGRSKIAKLRAGDCRIVAEASRGALKGSALAPRRSPIASGTIPASRRPTPAMVAAWRRASFSVSAGLGRRALSARRRVFSCGPHSGVMVASSGDSDSEPNSILAPLMPSASP
jgi:hypothetical protein